MKRKLSVILLTTALSAALMFGGCGAKSNRDSGADSSVNQATDDVNQKMSASEGAADTAPAESSKSEDMAASDDSGGSADSSLLNGAADNATNSQTQKLIFTYNYSVETKEFDSFVEKVNKKTTEIGGYVESSETDGSVSDGSDRYASLVLRIPADKMDQMLSLLNKDSNITYQSRSSENVTLRYVDMESHLKVLRTEQTALLQLLEKADKLKDIIELQSRLTEIRYEIESYESQLRTFDNLVDYSTLYLNITEVERTTTVASAKTSFWEEAGNRFSDNIYALGQWLRSSAIDIIGALPVLVPLAVVLVCVILFLNKRRKKQRENTVDSSETES